MNRIKEVDVTIHLVESVCLALLTLCLALPFAMLFREGSLWADLLWGAGTILPVQLIREICERIKDKKKQLWICLGILALSILIPTTMMRRFYYAICCLPILLAGLVLGQPNGKLVLVTPRVYFPLAGLMLFAFGKISELPMLSAMAVGISVLQILDYLLYRNQTKLRSAIFEDRDGHVSVASLVSQNRKLVAGFLLLGMICVALIPQLMKMPEQGVEDDQPYVNILEQRPEDSGRHEVLPEEKVFEVGEDKKWDWDSVKTVMDVLFYLFVLCALITAVVGVVYVLRNLNNDKEIRRKSKDDEFVVERLSRKKQAHEIFDESRSPYEKKIRRRYGGRILQTARKDAKLSPLTPTELEDAAGLPQCEERAVIHRLYAKARYGAEPSTKEDYRELKSALHRLEKQS